MRNIGFSRQEISLTYKQYDKRKKIVDAKSKIIVIYVLFGQRYGKPFYIDYNMNLLQRTKKKDSLCMDLIKKYTITKACTVSTYI